MQTGACSWDPRDPTKRSGCRHVGYGRSNRPCDACAAEFAQPGYFQPGMERSAAEQRARDADVTPVATQTTGGGAGTAESTTAAATLPYVSYPVPGSSFTIDYGCASTSMAAAQAAKDAGNAAFKAKDYRRALVAYQGALDAMPHEMGGELKTLYAAVHGNRAECHLQMREWQLALDDAVTCRAVAERGSAVAAKARSRIERAKKGLAAALDAGRKWCSGSTAARGKRERLVKLVYRALGVETDSRGDMDWFGNPRRLPYAGPEITPEEVAALPPLEDADLGTQDFAHEWDAARAVACALAVVVDEDARSSARVPEALLLAARACAWLSRLARHRDTTTSAAVQGTCSARLFASPASFTRSPPKVCGQPLPSRLCTSSAPRCSFRAGWNQESTSGR